MRCLRKQNKILGLSKIKDFFFSGKNKSISIEKSARVSNKVKVGSFLLSFFIILSNVFCSLQASSTGTPILGAATATVEKAKNWARNHPRATEEFISLADIYWQLAPAVGVDPALAYAQAAHETGYGTFTGVLDASYHNPCGMKTSDGGDNDDQNRDAHMRFPDWQTGIQAHIDHLALYAGAPGYPDPNSPDPRHFPYLYGIAPTLEELNGKWATNEAYVEILAGFLQGVQLGRQISEIEQFVNRLYHAGLGRAADLQGMAHWSDQLRNGRMAGAAVAEQFLLSEELGNKNLSDREYLQVLYVAMMNRTGDPSGLAYWEDYMKNGVSRTGILRQFLLSAEFQGLCDRYKIQRGTPKVTESRDENLDLTVFISQQYRSILDRSADINGLNYWSNLILHQNQSIESVANAFMNSEEFKSRNYDNEDYVQILYWAFMNRASDKAGMTHWTGKLNQSTAADLTRVKQEVFEEFAYSEEFKNIIRSYGLTPSERTIPSTVMPTPTPTPTPTGGALAGKVIIIDAGHGGTDSGADHEGKILEKNLTLEMATLTKKELENAGATVVMTRTNDSWVSLYNRIALAHLVSMQYVREKGISPLTMEEEAWYKAHMENIRQKNSRQDSSPANQGIMAGTGVSDELKKLFAFEHKLDKEVIYISIHVNSAVLADGKTPNPAPRGLQVYFPTDSAIEASEINQENGDFKNLSREEFPRRPRYNGRPNAQNAALATSMLNSIIGEIPALEGNWSNTIAGNYAYLREHGLVCVMVETGFLTNQKDRELLQNKEVQAGIAVGIRDGCIDYFSK